MRKLRDWITTKLSVMTAAAKTSGLSLRGWIMKKLSAAAAVAKTSGSSLWKWIMEKLSAAAAAAKNRRPQKAFGFISNSKLLYGWMPPLVFLMFSITSTILGRFDWGFLWLALAVLYVRLFLKEVRAPDQAYVYRFGRMIGKVGPGWYIAIPHFTDLELVERKVFNVEFEKQRFYTGAGTEILVNLIATFQIGNTEEEMERALELDREERGPLFKHMVLSKVATAIGGQDGFLGLNKRQTNVEELVLHDLQTEAQKYGYVVKEVEVYIEEERVVAEAERIKIIGQARGEEARAIAEPLKDNWPAAAVATANMVFGGAVRDIKKAAGSKKGVKAASDGINAVGKAVDAVKGIFSDKDGGE